MQVSTYHKAIELLEKCSSNKGFLASSEVHDNYKRVWARDGVICGIAAIASGNESLIKTFEKTIETLATNQHEMGTIPSNVAVEDDGVSYGGLAGRVDAVTWFMIGVCQLAHYKNDAALLNKYDAHIQRCIALLNAWEFNNRHLIYVPLSGNWADEYITDGYTLYDQLLRLWALKSYNFYKKEDQLAIKIKEIQLQVETNFLPNTTGNPIHPKAYKNIVFKGYYPASFSPAGYKTQFDAFANALAMLLHVGTSQQLDAIATAGIELAGSLQLGLLPAFWPPVMEGDTHWDLLKDNCKYDFRNIPYEFHNGGTWSMVNGFYGMALHTRGFESQAGAILENINTINAVSDYGFYENFNTQTGNPSGVKNCAWSAAATVMLHQVINNNFNLFVP